MNEYINEHIRDKDKLGEKTKFLTGIGLDHNLKTHQSRKVDTVVSSVKIMVKNIFRKLGRSFMKIRNSIGPKKIR